MKADNEIWVRKIITVQQWAHEAQEGQELKPSQISPEEYKHYTVIFNKEEATRFPLSYEEELGIKFL